MTADARTVRLLTRIDRRLANIERKIGCENQDPGRRRRMSDEVDEADEVSY